MEIIEQPRVQQARRIDERWTLIPAILPVPGLGTLAVNSLLLEDDEPLLIDTGAAAFGEAWIEALRSRIAPEEIRWVWLSHTDADHIGNLAQVLSLAPNAKVLTSFLGAGKMGLMGFDTSRIELLEPGVPFTRAGRSLMPLRPPYYDAPETLGLMDMEGGLLFVADALGAVLPAPADSLHLVDDDTLEQGMRTWSAIDSPWLGDLDHSRFRRRLAALRGLAPERVVSSHLPFGGDLDRLTGAIESIWCGAGAPADPFVRDRIDGSLASEPLAA
ncbi:MAG TPA: MBL fold metallo-hydrolase [Thauera sp.]|nr:MBL fold metallo-hydrolase [Thauera sp.]